MDNIDKINYERYLGKLPILRAKLSSEELIEVDKFNKISQSLDLQSFDGEIWVDFRNTNGLYSISSYARIRRNPMKQWKDSRGKIRTGMPSKIIKQNSVKGYRYTMISVNNKQISFRIHRELGYHFIENPTNLPMINHKTGIRDDNRFWALEWSDNSNNQKHSYENNERENPRGMLGKTGYLCKNSKAVIQYDLGGVKISEFGSAAEAGRVLGLFASAISYCCTGKNKTSGGFKWKYK